MQKREREPWTVCRPCLGPLIALSHPATIPNAELDPDFFYTVNILAGRVGITLQDIYSGQPGRLSWVRDSALQLLDLLQEKRDALESAGFVLNQEHPLEGMGLTISSAEQLREAAGEERLPALEMVVVLMQRLVQVVYTEPFCEVKKDDKRCWEWIESLNRHVMRSGPSMSDLRSRGKLTARFDGELEEMKSFTAASEQGEEP